MTNWVLWYSISSIPFFVIAWRSALRGKYQAAVIFLLIGGALLRIGPSLDPFLHSWDERYHALVAKNMISDPFHPLLYRAHPIPMDRLNWTCGTIWLHKPPFALWCIALSLKLFGVSEFAVRVPSVVVSTWGIWICYAIVMRISGKMAGFVGAFLYATQGAVIEFASGRCATDHVDTMFTFLIGASVLLVMRSLEGRRISLLTFSGLVLGLAVLTKSWPALMVLPVAIFICSSQRSFGRAVGDASIMLLCCLIVALPWTFYAHRLDPQLAAYETRQMLAHLFTVVENQGGTWHYYLDRLRISYGELVYLPCIWYLIRARHVGRAPLRAAMAVWLLIPLVTYSVAATKMAGYLLPCTIPILAMTATCWVVMLRAEWRSKRLHRLAMVVMVALLALPVRYAVERLKPLQDLTPMLAKREALLQRISLSETDTWLINTDHPIEAMFYSDHLAVGDQDPESIDRVSNKR